MKRIEKRDALKYAGVIAIIVIGFALDLWSKQWAQTALAGRPVPTVLVPGFLELDFTRNHGMVFGILNNGGRNLTRTLLTILRTLILIGVLVFTVVKRRERFAFLLPFALILAGAGGNVLDGLTTGYVVDFIHIHAGGLLDWPFLFNVADVYLVAGMALLLIYGNLVRPNKTAAAAGEKTG